MPDTAIGWIREIILDTARVHFDTLVEDLATLTQEYGTSPCLGTRATRARPKDQAVCSSVNVRT
jgi:hypothetical protein